ncbi:MAG TPA: tyrosine-type recombinase/integrase [Solirubrobacterales bacterium]
MSKPESNPRVYVERNIYYRRNAKGQKVYEISWRDSTGKQCRRVVGVKISAARTERDKELAKRGRNEPAPANPRLTLGEAADGYLSNKVADLRDSTQDAIKWAIRCHLRPRFGTRRLDRISADDWAGFIRDLRSADLAEGSIETVLKAARGIYAYAARRLDWNGRDTLSLLDRSELPNVSDKAPRRLFSKTELAATLRAATGQNRVIFATAGTVGSRISETLGLDEDNLDLADLDEASISFTHQIDRKGHRVPLKTKAAIRTVEIPRQLAVMLAEHLLATADRRGRNEEPRYVFCTSSGKPLSQRNVARELRAAMKAAVLEGDQLAFPILSEVDEQGKPVKIERGQLPSFHSLRHSAASEAIAAGDGAEEVSWLLGHASSNVTRAVYVHEIHSVERATKRRSRLEARMGDTLADLGSAHGSASPKQKRSKRNPEAGKVVELGGRRSKAI